MEDVRSSTHVLAGSSILISVICDASTLAAEALLAFMFSSAAGVFIAFMVLVLSFIPLALAAGVFVAFMVLVSGFIPLALAAGVFIAFTVLASALSAGNLQAIQASLFEPKQRRHGTVFLQQTDLVYLHS